MSLLFCLIGRQARRTGGCENVYRGGAEACVTAAVLVWHSSTQSATSHHRSGHSAGEAAAGAIKSRNTGSRTKMKYCLVDVFFRVI